MFTIKYIRFNASIFDLTLIKFEIFANNFSYKENIFLVDNIIFKINNKIENQRSNLRKIMYLTKPSKIFK